MFLLKVSWGSLPPVEFCFRKFFVKHLGCFCHQLYTSKYPKNLAWLHVSINRRGKESRHRLQKEDVELLKQILRLLDSVGGW